MPSGTGVNTGTVAGGEQYSSAAQLCNLLEQGSRALTIGASGINARIHIVIGNEACDADSCISALVQSLVMASNGSASHNASGSAIIIPVISCTRSDWTLRRESGVIIKRWLGGDENYASVLIFLDDILPVAQSLNDVSLLSITLVDHNVLTGELAAWGWSERVVSIVDHHEDAGAHMGAERKIDWDPSASPPRGAGSCCSILALAAAAEVGLLDKPLATALLSVIALDCIGFDAAAGKVTKVDEAAVEKLTSTANMQSVSQLFVELSSLRADPTWWCTLPPRDALRVDYKGFTAGGEGLMVGTSALMISITRWLDAGEKKAVALRDFARERDLDVCILFSLQGGGEGGGGPPTRQLAFFTPTTTGERAVTAALSTLTAPGGAGYTWGLREVIPSGVPGLHVFDQADARVSRKQIAPRFLEALASA